MEELHVQIQHPNGTHERSLVQAAQATIGSGAHCDVRLAPDQAAFEHFEIELVADGARIRRLAESPPAFLNGAGFTVAPLATSAMLVVGGTQIYLERRAGAVVAPSKVNGVSVAKGLVVGALLLAIVAILGMPAPEAAAAPSLPPEIFGSPTLTCPHTDPGEARVRGEDARARAEAARERAPFEPREIVGAVKAYDLAAACFRVAGDEPSATDASAIAREIEAEARLELRMRHLRLGRMLALKDVDVARQDLTVLRLLTEGQRGPYAPWLSEVERDLKSMKPEKK